MINISDKVTHTIDCGRNSGVIYYIEENKHEILTHAQILDLPNKLPEGSFIVGERAHFGVPRTKKSLAQVFTEDQLFQFYSDFEKNNIKFRMSAHDNAPQARTYSEINKIIPPKSKMDPKKLDQYDATALAYYLNTHDKVRNALQKPPKTFEKSPRRKDGEAFREKLNENLNIARSEGYDQDSLPTMKIIMDNSMDLYNHLTPRSRQIIGLELTKKGDRVTKNSINDRSVALYSIAGLVFDIDGIPMTRYGNKIPGWTFARRFVLAFSPNHRRGGVAASNLKYHGFRSFVRSETKGRTDVNFSRKFKLPGSKGETNNTTIKRGHMTKKENEVFVELRKEYTTMIHEVWQFFANLACKNGDYVMCGQENMVEQLV